MPRTIRPADRAVLRFLDEQADALRRALGLHQRGEIVAWYEGRSGAREYEVVANGFGQFALVAYEGRNPNDRLEYHQATYDDEEAAGDAAMRLGAHGVAWRDRDKPVPDADEVGAVT